MIDSVQKKSAPHSEGAVAIGTSSMVINVTSIMFLTSSILMHLFEDHDKWEMASMACVCGVVSIVLAGIGLNKAINGCRKYSISPELYWSKSGLIAGKVMSIISIILSSLSILVAVVAMVYWEELYSKYGTL